MIRKIKIRRARPADALKIRNLHKKSVEALCKTHYTKAQIRAWVGNRAVIKYKKSITEAETYIAVTPNGNIVGFIELIKNLVRALYIHPVFAGKGIGQQLMAHVEKSAREKKMRTLVLRASLNAQSFYRKQGWKKVRPFKHTFPNGQVLRSTVMKKRLKP
jgi:ribosomal protein S18 acetylase RimI-like enzyme